MPSVSHVIVLAAGPCSCRIGLALCIAHSFAELVLLAVCAVIMQALSLSAGP